MVVITCKRSEADAFLFETTTSASADEVTRTLCAIWNMRERLVRLADAAESLAKHGRALPESERGLDAGSGSGSKSSKVGAGAAAAHYSPDPLGVRDGDAPMPSVAEVIMKTCEDARAAVSKNQAAMGVAVTLPALQEKMDNIRGAVTMAYPMGLPEWDAVRMLIEDAGDAYLQEVMGNDYMPPDTASLWWAGKEFFRDQTIGDRVGKNEKTKVVARLQRPGSGAPVREPAVSEEERRAMMAWYFKKQEEEKSLAADADDTYLSAKWADPRALKAELQGTGGIGFRGVARR